MTQWLSGSINLIGQHPLLSMAFAFLAATAVALPALGRFVPSTALLLGAGLLVGMGKLNFAPILTATLLGALIGEALSLGILRAPWKLRLRAFVLLPAIGLGHGIAIASMGNPRLLVVISIVMLIAFVVWLGFRFAAAFMAPERFCPLAWAMIALSGFLLLIIALRLAPELAYADAAINQFVQDMRTDAIDPIMVGATMLGDGTLLTSIAVAFVFSLWLYRQWRLGTMVALVFVGTSQVVPMLKGALHRSRPSLLYADAQSFSFPSGHATLSATIIGIIVLILAHRLPSFARRFVWISATIVVCLIGFSRVYLQAHWPSDVVAGILLGATVMLLLARRLQDQVHEFPRAEVAGIVVMTLAIAFQWHVFAHIDRERDRYAQRAPPTLIDSSEWTDTGWSRTPLRRSLLDGEVGEPMVLQTNLDLRSMTAKLRQDGWERANDSGIDSLGEILVPTRAALTNRSVLPLSNAGRKPLMTMFKLRANGNRTGIDRLVLRLWRTGFATGTGEATQKVISISLTVETIETLFAGFGWVAEKRIAPDEIALAVDLVAGLLPGRRRIRHADGLDLWTIEALSSD